MLMRKQIVVLLLALLLLPWATAALASDLPIDIEAIGEMGAGGREAVTVGWGVDLFSERAAEINAALLEQLRQRQETAVSGLFGVPTGEPDLGVTEQVVRAADESALFASPMQFGRAGPAVEEATEIPTWVFIVVLAAAAVLGFLFARAMIERKEQKADVSHADN